MGATAVCFGRHTAWHSTGLGEGASTALGDPCSPVGPARLLPLVLSRSPRLSRSGGEDTYSRINRNTDDLGTRCSLTPARWGLLSRGGGRGSVRSKRGGALGGEGWGGTLKVHACEVGQSVGQGGEGALWHCTCEVGVVATGGVWRGCFSVAR